MGIVQKRSFCSKTLDRMGYNHQYDVWMCLKMEDGPQHCNFDGNDDVNDDDGDGFDDGYDDHGGCSDNGYVNVADEKGVPGLRKNNSTDMSCPVMFHVGLVLFGHIKSCDKECPSTRLGIVHGG